MDKKEFIVHFGALAKPIEEQVKEQGFQSTEKGIKQFNDLNHARLMLLFGNCITDTENDKIMKKIFNQFKKTIKSI
jgi:hypothetical protein